MTLWKLLLGLLLVILTLYSAIGYLFVTVVNEVDNNGGLKAVVERIWEGKK